MTAPIHWQTVDKIANSTTANLLDTVPAANIIYLAQNLRLLEETDLREHPDHPHEPLKLHAGCDGCLDRVREDQHLASIPEMSDDDLLSEYYSLDLDTVPALSRLEQALVDEIDERGLTPESYLGRPELRAAR